MDDPRPPSPPPPDVEASASARQPVAPRFTPAGEVAVAELELLDAGRPSLVGDLIADRYRVERLLGVGGMGAVYYAEHVAMQKPVAVKVLHRQLVALPEVVARFEREAIAAGRINDPHVVTATDFGRLPDGSFYLALEYVSGTGLADVIRQGPLGALRALRITRQILQALAAAHAAGVVHRDLKPENVMLVARAEDPDFVKVLDFGIAKIGDGRTAGVSRLTPGGVLTRMGSVFGTPQYMSPEQAAGQEVDARADLYTVGIILYEMLAGRPPFVADDVARVLAMHLTQPPAPLPDTVDPGVAAVALHLLAKNPAERPQTAEEAIGRVDQGLRSLGVSHPSFAAILLDDYGTYAEAVSELRCNGSPPLDAGVPAAPTPPPDGLAPVAASAPAGRRGVPLWVLAAAVSASLGIAAIVFVGRGDRGGAGDERVTSASAVASRSSDGPLSAALDPELAMLFARATLGNREAIAALEARPDVGRSAPEWVALARGRMATGVVKEAFEAYLAAIERDPKVTEDPTFREHMRRLAYHDLTSDAAMRFAAARLGPDGADLLYEIWVNTKAKNARTQLAKQLVYSDAVRANATPALSILLDLRAAIEAHEGETLPSEPACAAIARLLPSVVLHGDQRALRVLQPLQRKSGCGENEAVDCHPCLREGSALVDAVAAARSRPSPQ
ncbi:MAG: protein kinase [Polyangiaceae bacterium]|nr:protein kinase [Polyangiaceae bacterium]